jgi:hypothetical protein
MLAKRLQHLCLCRLIILKNIFLNNLLQWLHAVNDADFPAPVSPELKGDTVMIGGML